MTYSDTTDGTNSYQPALTRRGLMRTAAGAGAVAAGVAGGPGTSSAASQASKYVIVPFYYGAKGVQQIVTSVTGSIFQGKSDDVTAAEVHETAVQQST